ncbi:MAG: LysM peptidoglycan-binding domain-containing protein [Chloroflexi bacterium]|nr:LysM peptidoglycan-binding domain-containing protein [Chloroflexota bacterium]
MMILLVGMTSCERPDPAVTDTTTPTIVPTTSIESLLSPPTPILSNGSGIAAPLPDYIGIPTPDAPHAVSEGSAKTIIHTVAAGETMGYIAQLYGHPLDELLTINALAEADLVFIGQEIAIPSGAAQLGPTFKIIPNSELVYGPAARGFDARQFLQTYNSRLLTYQEEVEGQLIAGSEIVMLVSNRYSVNPRLLLAVLEYQGHWVTQVDGINEIYMLGYEKEGAEGLYAQLGWAANQLNLGYYGRSEGNRLTTSLSDDSRIAFAAEINHGTAGVQQLFAAATQSTQAQWQQDVGSEGLFATFVQLFGNPFAYTVDPLIPRNTAQPPLQLPWANGETWYFTGGPHGGWASGSAWAALDFVPSSEQLGCVQSDAWVRAMADGIVTRSGFGAVVVDSDGDGFAGTGWAITYMHLETRDRIPVGTPVQTGDPLGHPSCEGGYSNGTHVHVARTFNGRWISADGSLPFDMGGWVSQGLGREYDGLLVRGNITKEACVCREDANMITGE